MSEEFYQAIGEGLPDTDESDYLYLLNERPLLAHYTSTRVLESIIKNNEIWFSNPLFMNDLEELRFGMNIGSNIFSQSVNVFKKKYNEEKVVQIERIFRYLYEEFTGKHQLDIYVFCLSEHNPANEDGTLSMWRAYGGRGNRAAMVFKTDFLTDIKDAPFIMARVEYGSTEDRNNKMLQAIKRRWGNVERLDPSEDLLFSAVHRLFESIKIFSLIHKHAGFKEEKEWRIIYLAQHDEKGLLKPHLHYLITDNGIEPKLKFPISPLQSDIERGNFWSLESILHSIILGPSLSSPISHATVARMLQINNRNEIISRVRNSTIPLRPTP